MNGDPFDIQMFKFAILPKFKLYNGTWKFSAYNLNKVVASSQKF